MDAAALEKLRALFAAMRAIDTDLQEETLALIGRSLSWIPNPDGTVDGHYPNGDKDPSPGTAAWGDLSAIAAAIQSTTVSSNVSIDVRAALTGSAAATATIGVTTESGSDVTTTGWNQPGSGDDLEISSATEGSGALRLTATVSGNTVVSDPIPWARVAAVVGDVLAPGAITGLAGVPVEGGIDWTFDAPNDQHDGTRAGSGIKEIDLELDGNITVIAAQPGITAAPTATNIGSISSPGAPTAVQSGRNWTLTAAGTAIDGTADQALFLNWPVSGDCSITAKIASFSGTGNVYAPAALAIREDLSAGSKYVALVRLLSELTQGIQGKQRVLTGGSRSTIASLAGNGTDFWLRIERAGDVFTLLYSHDGLGWTTLATTTVAMSASVYIGVLVSSMQAGSNVAAQFNDVNPSTSPRITYSQVTASATHARARARDLAGTPNVGSYSALSADVTPLPAADLIKWLPGIRVIYSTLNTYSATRAAQVETLKTLGVKGMGYWFTWRDVEQTRGVYDFQKLRDARDALAALGLDTHFQLQDRTFSGTSKRCPDYLATEIPSGGIYTKGTGGTVPKYWDSTGAIMARLNALFQALSDEFDASPTVASIRAEESDVAFSTNEYTAAGFDPQVYLSQLKAHVDFLCTVFPTTMKFAGWNFMDTQSRLEELAIYTYERTGFGLGIMASDIVPGTRSWSQRIFDGETWFNGAWVPRPDGTNWHDRAIYEGQIQDPEMGGKAGQFSPLQFYNEIVAKSMRFPFIWDKNFPWTQYQYAANAQTYWDSTLAGPSLRWFSFLGSGNHPVNVTIPSLLTGKTTAG